ncbi:hypothetical protein GS399_19650 [Pedobacter sp. HMF7647]|uniref:Uncharacterized protein n=1 Tax=Hufsiella arboris TaxID=2695275 RepID=A0A7K1YF06_9SPHI|nr:hypothetical protein [Hufsiella arboris]MXV53187.1 hypothetical protein [Hufsiella arboris]
MKKLVAISLLVIFLFNIIGYKIFFYYLKVEADKSMEVAIEKITNQDKRLIQIKIPIGLPYQTNWKNFERVDGEVSFKGKTYRYVKQRVYNDTLILLCIDYHEKSKIEKSSSDYFKKVNDLNSDTNKKPIFKVSKIDYFEEVKNISFALYAFGIHSVQLKTAASCQDGFARVPDNPPKPIASLYTIG